MVRIGNIIVDNYLIEASIIERSYYDRKEKKDLLASEYHELLRTLTPEEFNGRFVLSGILPNKQLVYSYPTKSEK